MTMPGVVRVAMAIDAGIASVFGIGAAVGVARGGLGGVLVAAEAATWAAVILAWVFPVVWSHWQSVLDTVSTIDTGAPAPRVLRSRPPTRVLLLGATAFTVLVLAQMATTVGATVEFRTVVDAFVITLSAGVATLAAASDVRWMLAATADRDRTR